MKLPRIFLAPMAELSTPALRKYIRSNADETVLFTEMLSASALINGGMRNDYLSRLYDFDKPICVQLIGNNPDAMEKAAQIIEDANPFSVDINMGCSAPEIIQKGWGSALMRDEANAIEIVKRLRRRVKKLSVKIRSGFRTSDPQSLLKFARNIQDEGADFITLHARQSDMAFKRRADWSLIRHLNDNLTIPVIGNGDLENVPDIISKIENDHCAAVMIGRNGVRKPWLFSIAQQRLAGFTGEIKIDAMSCALEILQSTEEMVPPEFIKPRILKFCAYFCTGLSFGHQLFSEINKCPDKKNASEKIRLYFERNPGERFVSDK